MLLLSTIQSRTLRCGLLVSPILRSQLRIKNAIVPEVKTFGGRQRVTVGPLMMLAVGVLRASVRTYLGLVGSLFRYGRLEEEAKR